MRKLLISFLVGATTLLPACSLYRIDVQQGNTLDTKVIAHLKEGMTRRQVQFLMGTPLIQDPFHKNRWDYVYTFKPGGGKLTRQHLTIFFEGDKVARIDKSALRGGTDDVGMGFDPDFPPVPREAASGGHAH